MKKLFFVALIGPMVIMFDSCASHKSTIPERTLAQVCADSFPCKDSLVFIEVEVEVPKDSIVYVDSTQCPPSDTSVWVFKKDTLYMPGKRVPVKTTVLVPSQIDSALRVAYKDLQAQYAQSIQDLKDCQARTKEKAKPRADWKVWLMALGLLLIVIVQVWSKRKD
jgi:hypothetical protein